MKAGSNMSLDLGVQLKVTLELAVRIAGGHHTSPTIVISSDDK